jgi:excisionase family DNA binding protein
MYFVLPPAAREFYTASEAAALFGVSVDTIRDWRKRRLLRTVRTPGGRVRIPAADIEALVPPRKRGTREPSARDR